MRRPLVRTYVLWSRFFPFRCERFTFTRKIRRRQKESLTKDDKKKRASAERYATGVFTIRRQSIDDERLQLPINWRRLQIILTNENAEKQTKPEDSETPCNHLPATWWNYLWR